MREAAGVLRGVMDQPRVEAALDAEQRMRGGGEKRAFIIRVYGTNNGIEGEACRDGA